MRAPTRLRLSYQHGVCDTTYGSRAHETPEVVVVDVDVRDDVRSCVEMGRTDVVEVTLREPLGRRVVLDSGNGVPVLPESDVRLSEFRNYDPRRS